MAEISMNADSFYEQKAAEIAANFSYDNFYVARRELFAHMRVPSLTIRPDSLTFNTACINGLEDVVYIELMVSNKEKRIAIRKSEENNKDSLRWCIAKPDKRKSRKMSGERFTKGIYEMMDWDPECRYKVTGYRIFFEGEYLYVFELTNPDVYHEPKKRTKAEKEELKKSMSEEEYSALQKKERAYTRKPFYPDDVENTFGVPVKEHNSQVTLGDTGSYSTAEGMGGRRKQTEEPASTSVTDASNVAAGDAESHISADRYAGATTPARNLPTGDRIKEEADYGPKW